MIRQASSKITQDCSSEGAERKRRDPKVAVVGEIHKVHRREEKQKTQNPFDVNIRVKSWLKLMSHLWNSFWQSCIENGWWRISASIKKNDFMKVSSEGWYNGAHIWHRLRFNLLEVKIYRIQNENTLAVLLADLHSVIAIHNIWNDITGLNREF